jgi:1,4-alpha-glucan branching enzyme
MNTAQIRSSNANPSMQNPLKLIAFFYAAPGAKSVGLAGDFNQWIPLPMVRLHDGWWFAEARMCHGRHQYRFLVDGSPMLDPHAPGVDRDEHHEPVSVILVI